MPAVDDVLAKYLSIRAAAAVLWAPPGSQGAPPRREGRARRER